MEQNKRLTTVTVTGNEESVTFTDNKVFLVGGKRSLISVSCKFNELLEFAVCIQVQFIKSLLPRLMQVTKSGITEEMLFDAIVDIAKDSLVDPSEVS